MTLDDEDITRLRTAVIRIARRVDRQIPNDGYSTSQHMILATLANRGPLGIGELAELEGLNPTMASRLVGRLETAELVRRRPGDDDGRAVQVEITAAGKRLQTRRREERSKIFADHLADLPDDVTRRLRDSIPALEELAEHLIIKATPRPRGVR